MNHSRLPSAVDRTPASLWQQFGAGDAQALGALADLFYRPLLNYGLRFSTDRELLRDLLQELFLDLWTRRQTLTEPDNVKAYLLGAYRNKIYKERNRTEHLPTFSELPFEGGPDAIDASVESVLIQAETHQYNHRRIQHLLSALPRRQQEVIYLHYYEGLEANQVADVMGIGRQGVYNLLSRTLKDLRAAWANTGALKLIILLIINGLR